MEAVVQQRRTLVSLGNKSNENRLIKENNPFKEAGNHPPDFRNGEDVDSLLVQVKCRLRHDLTIEKP